MYVIHTKFLIFMYIGNLNHFSLSTVFNAKIFQAIISGNLFSPRDFYLFTVFRYICEHSYFKNVYFIQLHECL